jgi:predicted DNA-binding protein YlxM (UPF0122 family)
MFQKNVEIGYLLDFYGGLLSERRRTVLDLYYNEDMSLSEIAEALSITRQGARDLIKKSGDELLLFEEKLGMAKKFLGLCDCADRAEHIISQIDDEQSQCLLEIVNEIRQIIE